MKYYFVAEIETTDRSWISGYVKDVTPMVERWGGRYLARTSRLERIEGDRNPSLLLMIEWPSKEAAMGFYESAEYKPYRQARVAGAHTYCLLAAGEDIANAARIA